MRIFVTGGNGQLGRAFASLGAEKSGLFASDEFYFTSHDKDDITQPGIIKTIRDFKPDAVIHGAALTDVDACEKDPKQAFVVNEQGSSYVAQGAREAGAVVVYVSTDYVFDGSKNVPYLETDLTNPVNEYGRSKLAGERVTASKANRWIVVRTSWVYGKGQRKNFVTNVLEWAKTQPELKLVENKTGSPTYAIDLALVIRFLIGKKVDKQIYHVSGKGACTWVEYGKEILRIAGIDKKIVPIRFEELNRPAVRPGYTVLDIGALAKAGLLMRPWQVALKEFMQRGV